MAAPELHINEAGTNKEVLELHVNEAGTNKEVLEGWVNESGTNKQFWPSEIPNPYGNDFVFDIFTTLEAPVFQLAPVAGGVYDAHIEWGDGSSDDITAYNDPALAHIYDETGTHEIHISGLFPRPRFGNPSQNFVLEVKNFGDVGVTHYDWTFYKCVNLTKVTSFSGNNAPTIISASHMFRECRAMTQCELGSLDMSGCVDFNSMFFRLDSLESIDLTGLVTAAAEDISYMLSNVPKVLHFDASSWDTSNVTNMLQTFGYALGALTINVDGWDTSKVTMAHNLFVNCDKVTTINTGHFRFPVAENLGGVFFQCQALEYVDVADWGVTSTCTYMYGMFNFCRALQTVDISKWDTSGNQYFGDFFRECNVLTSVGGDLFDLDTSSAIEFDYMFYNTPMLKGIRPQSWNIGLVGDSSPSLNGFENTWFGASVFPVGVYDAMLRSYAAHPRQPYPIHFSPGAQAKFTRGGAEEDARDLLIAEGWFIWDWLTDNPDPAP